MTTPSIAQSIVDSLMRNTDPKNTEKLFLMSQINLTADAAIKLEDSNPAFAAYKDNYFLTGVPLNKKISKETADAIFRVSIRQRMSKSVLPFKTFLYITYSQKSFWQIYKKSSPFRDNNYNPGIGFGKYIVNKDKLRGAVFIQIQHESNGKEDIESRSWNFISLAGKYFFNPWITIRVEGWIPYVDGENNKDLIDYRGYGVISLNAINPSNRWWLSLDVNPRKGFGNANLTLGIGYRLTKKSYQYLFAQAYNGYSESLLDYNKYSNYFRIGICFKPSFYSIY